MHLGNWHVQILQILMAAHTGDLVLLDSTKNRKTRNFSSSIGLCSCQGARAQQNNPLKLQVFLQFTDLGSAQCVSPPKEFHNFSTENLLPSVFPENLPSERQASSLRRLYFQGHIAFFDEYVVLLGLGLNLCPLL